MNTLHPRWNEGRVVGPRIGFEQSEVQQLAAQMNAAVRLREQALLATGVDTMLRASDLLRLKVRDVMTTSGIIRETLLWRQQKTGGTVAPVLTLSPARRWRRGSRPATSDRTTFCSRARGILMDRRSAAPPIGAW